MPDEPSQADDPEGPTPAQSQHFEDVNAPIVYADDCWGGGHMNGGNITLTFATKILNHTMNPPGSHTKTVLRLVLPRSAAEGMADFIKQFLAPAAPEAEMTPPVNRKLN